MKWKGYDNPKDLTWEDEDGLMYVELPLTVAKHSLTHFLGTELLTLLMRTTKRLEVDRSCPHKSRRRSQAANASLWAIQNHRQLLPPRLRPLNLRDAGSLPLNRPTLQSKSPLRRKKMALHGYPRAKTGTMTSTESIPFLQTAKGISSHVSSSKMERRLRWKCRYAMKSVL